jgi:glutathione synthase/RimK-type ligase-like ATP-grasp enzyme
VSLVAVATCAGEDVDVDSAILLEALGREGVDAVLAVWDDPTVAWDRFDLVVVRSTWDYAPRRAQFLDWARSVARLANPYPVIEYSSDKHYLSDLAARGHAVVATQFIDVGDEAVFPDVDFVVKPCVGAGSIDADRYRPDELERATSHVERLHASGRDAMVQPYVDSVDTDGERALVFIDGSFSHAMTKAAMLNVAPDERDWLFRREQMSRATGEPEALVFAQRVLEGLEFDELLYARVDLVRTRGGWAVMELELVEPSLFLSYDEASPSRLARAIKARLHR